MPLPTARKLVHFLVLETVSPGNSLQRAANRLLLSRVNFGEFRRLLAAGPCAR
jgi:hypothetical protein